MIKIVRLSGVIVLCLITLSILIIPQTTLVAAEKAPVLYVFWGEGCPHCEEEKEFLEVLHKRSPDFEMRWFEVWKHPQYAKLADAVRKAAGVKTTSVPMTFIGDWNMVGFRSAETSGVKIIEQIDRCLKSGCKDVLDTLGPQLIVEEIRSDISKGEFEDWEYFPAKQKE